MRFIVLFAFLELIHLSCYGQSGTGIHSLSYGGVGVLFPSTGMKKHSLFANGVSVARIGHFQGIGKARELKNEGRLQWGFELHFDYSKFKKSRVAPSSVRNIRYSNGTATPATVNLQLETEAKKPDAFEYLLGPSVVISRKNYFIGGSLLIGYASVSQEHFLFTDSIRYVPDPSQNAKIEFYAGGHETNNGIVFMPSLKAGCRFAKNWSGFLALDYSFGSAEDFTDGAFIAFGPVPPNGVYDFQQVKNAALKSVERKSRLSMLSLSINLAFTLPSHK